MVKDAMRSTHLIDFAAGAVAAETAVIQNTKIDLNRLQGCRPGKIDFGVEWRGKTTLEGPAIYGLAEGMTVSQLKQWWQSDPQHDGDMVAATQSQAHVLVLGYIAFVSTSGNGDQNVIGGTGKSQRKWPGWQISEGEVGLDFFVMNIGLAPMTTGLLLDGFLHIRGDWIDK